MGALNQSQAGYLAPGFTQIHTTLNEEPTTQLGLGQHLGANVEQSACPVVPLDNESK